MTLDLDALPDDVDALHRLIRELAAQQDGDRTELAQARTEIQRLRFIVQRLQRHQFGRRSERVNGDQLALGFEDVETDIARIEARLPAIPPSAPSSEPAPRRPKLPNHLPREDVRLDVDGQACPGCGGALHAIGESISEMLDYVPARLRVLRVRRPK